MNLDFIRPSWQKVMADLKGDKTRTILVIASIAVGVFAIGAIVSTYVILSRDIGISYASAQPANIEIITDPFDDELVKGVENVPGVQKAEGRQLLAMRVGQDGQSWRPLDIVAVDDPSAAELNLLTTVSGTKYPGDRELVVREDMMNTTGLQPGETALLQLADGTVRSLPVAGTVGDQYAAGDFSAPPRGYVTLDTAEWLGGQAGFNRLYVQIDAGNDEAAIDAVAAEVEDKVERTGRAIYRTNTNKTTEHPMESTVLALVGVLGVLGVLIMFLSSSLIINTLNALLTQHRRQIGVMKLVGARGFNISVMYIALIIGYGIIALIIAVPLGVIAGYGLASFMGGMLSIDIQGFRVVPIAVVIQIVLAFAVSLIAGYFPVNAGAKMTVRRAISEDNPAEQKSRVGLVDRLGVWFTWLSRPLLISIRNTFRRKARLALTLFTLVMAGAIFIGVFNVRASLNGFMDTMSQHFLADVMVTFKEPYRAAQIERELQQIPGVKLVESWGAASAEVLDENDNVDSNLIIIAPPEDTSLLEVDMVDGRWLEADDEKVLIVSDAIWEEHPDFEVGDTLRVQFPGGRAEEWPVVGIYRFISMAGDMLAYANYDTISYLTNTPGQATSYRIVAQTETLEGQQALSQTIDQFLRGRGYKISNVEAGKVTRQQQSQAMVILVVFLMTMAILTAVVGSIGLMGTMGMNVLERTREIGVMRAIGAVDGEIIKSVVIEGVMIGLISWVMAVVLSFPISFALLRTISTAMMGTAMPLEITMLGPAIWLGVVIFLSIVASIWPARNAARLTIREVLAYE